MCNYPYIGRFAPSPTGPLHFGSLVTAVASYLDAKSNSGEWILRIEDIDPAREQRGAPELILNTLDKYGLHWDGAPIYQSNHLDKYNHFLEAIIKNGYTFYCICTKKQFKENKSCSGQCIFDKNSIDIYAVKFDTYKNSSFEDRVYGIQAKNAKDMKPCTLKRKDGFFAYQLAVVVDDALQKISHVVRGADLLDSTHWQQNLFKTLNKDIPIYAHIPLVIGANGFKLSKQYGAAAIPYDYSGKILVEALEFLSLKPPSSLKSALPREVLTWAQHHWKLPKIL